MPPTDIPIILLSGMAADERWFRAQVKAFPNLRVQPWIPAHRSESLRDYAARLAEHINVDQPCLVGGASFGGMVALELAAHLPVLGCILIGSIRSPAELPWRWRSLRPAAALGPEALRKFAWLASRFGRPVLGTGTTEMFKRLSRPEAAFVRWAMCAVVRWSPSPAAQQARVFHIHGEADPILSVKRLRPDVIVPGGTHALSFFSPTAVNEFITSLMQTVASEAGLAGAGGNVGW